MHRVDPTGSSVPLAILTLLAAALPGCIWFRAASPLELRSLDQSPVVLRLDLPYGGYAVHPSETSIVLSDHPLESLRQAPPRTGQILHAQVLWVPKPGTTPVAATATNVTLRWVVFSEGEVGVYGGAGFCWPSGRSGRDPIRIAIDGSTLSLIAATEGFVDLVSPAAITGTISAPYEPSEALQLRQIASQFVTDALGRTFWVGPPPEATLPPRAESSTPRLLHDPIEAGADLLRGPLATRVLSAAERHARAVCGGPEGEHCGLEPRGIPRSTAVELISNEGMAEVRKHRADLVEAAASEFDHQMVLPRPPRRGGAGQQLHRRGVSAAPNDLRDRADPPQVRPLLAEDAARVALDPCDIGLQDASLAERRSVVRGGFAVEGDQQPPAREPIEAMHQPRLLRAEAAAKLAENRPRLRFAGKLAGAAGRLPEHQLSRRAPQDLRRPIRDPAHPEAPARRSGSIATAAGESG